MDQQIIEPWAWIWIAFGIFGTLVGAILIAGWIYAVICQNRRSRELAAHFEARFK